MFKTKPHSQTVNEITAMEPDLNWSWDRPSVWTDIVDHVANLVVELKGHLNLAQIAMLMSIGAMAHRQSKVEVQAKKRITGEAYPTVQVAALALLSGRLGLNNAAGVFLADCVVDPKPLTPELMDYIALLLERAGMPPLAEGGAA